MKERILKYIAREGDMSPLNISRKFSLSKAMVHRHLNSLLNDGYIMKTGSTPKVLYNSVDKNHIQYNFNSEEYLKKLDSDNIHTTTRAYLDKVAKHKKPYIVEVFGEDIIIHPGVMTPAYEWSPYFLIDFLPQNLHDKTVLEIGCGSGVVSVHAHLRGASLVDASDISKDAVVNTQANFKKFKMIKSQVFHSDVFNSVPNKRYNILIFNFPYHNAKPQCNLEYGVMDLGYHALTKFFTDASEYLAKNGKIYISFSRSGNVGKLMEQITKNDFTITDMQELNHWDDVRFTSEEMHYNVQVYKISKKADSPLEYLKTINNNAQDINLKKDDTVVESGEFVANTKDTSEFSYTAVPLCLIRSGDIAIIENGKAIKSLKAGEFFGLFETAYYLKYKERKTFGNWTLIAQNNVILSIYDRSTLSNLPKNVQEDIISIGRKSRQPQPLTQLSTLDDFVHGEKICTPLKQVVVFYSHLLNSNYALIKHIASIVGYDNMFILEKPYSTINHVFRRVAQLGVHIFSVHIDKEMPYDFSIKKNTEYVWSKVVTHVAKHNIKNITIISDGADMLLSIPWRELETIKITAVEQTQNGIDKLLNSGKKIPATISVATSKLKKEYESPFIIEAVIDRLKARGLLKKHRKFGIIGHGSLGSLLCIFLKKEGSEYFVYDSLHSKYSDVSSLEELIKKSDVIIGTTGQNALRGLFIEKIFGEKTFVSVSSSNREFQYLFDLTKTYPNLFEDIILEITPTFTAYVINGGYPINFDRLKEREPRENIVLTRMLLFAGFLQALSIDKESGIFELNEKYNKKILKYWHPDS